jgi:hypothetical protein
MRAYELYEHTSERERYVDNKSVFVAAKVENSAVVSHEIDSTAELTFYLGWIGHRALDATASQARSGPSVRG